MVPDKNDLRGMQNDEKCKRRYEFQCCVLCIGFKLFCLALRFLATLNTDRAGKWIRNLKNKDTLLQHKEMKRQTQDWI